MCMLCVTQRLTANDEYQSNKIDCTSAGVAQNQFRKAFYKIGPTGNRKRE